MEISPTDYDVIVIGTGITESIVAAACSRVGKSVLHLDINRFYGEQWASFTLEQFEKLVRKEDEVEVTEKGVKYCNFLKHLVIENFVVDKVEEEVVIKSEENNNIKDDDSTDENNNIKDDDSTDENNNIKDDDSTDKNNNIKDDDSTDENNNIKDDDSTHEINNIKDDDSTEENNNIKDDDSTEGITLETNCTDNRKPHADNCTLEPHSDNTIKKKWHKEEFEKSKRRINIDITPKLVFSNGSMVNLLRDSNCSRYLEFKAINRCFVYHDNDIVKAPCNRAEVFSSTKLKILEKRLLMKFISFAMELDPESDEFKSWKDQSELELFKTFKLTDDLVQLIRSSLVRTNLVDIHAQDVLKHTKKFLKSVGVYGNLPFIFPIYGSGELPQAFARFSAVFGSVYVLDMGVDDITINDQGLFESLTLSNKQIITGKTCVVSPNYNSSKFTSRAVLNDVRISQAILILDQTIKPVKSDEDKDDISIMTFLPGQLSNRNIITLYEFGPGSYVPSQGQYLIQIQMRAESESPVVDLKLFVCALLELSGGAECLWAAYFSTMMKEEDRRDDVVRDNNIYYTSRPVFNSCYDDCIIEGRDIFNKIYEGEEFLPMAPNPEDIKWPDEEEKGVENGVEDGSQNHEDNSAVCEAKEDKISCETEDRLPEKLVDSNITEGF